MKVPNNKEKRGLRLALSRIEVAEILGIAPNSVDRLTKRGLLNPSRALRRPLYSLKEIERFLNDTTLEAI